MAPPPQAGFAVNDPPADTQSRGDGFWRGWLLYFIFMHLVGLQLQSSNCLNKNIGFNLSPLDIAVVLVCVVAVCWMLVSEPEEHYAVWRKFRWSCLFILFMFHFSQYHDLGLKYCCINTMLTTTKTCP